MTTVLATLDQSPVLGPVNRLRRPADEQLPVSLRIAPCWPRLLRAVCSYLLDMSDGTTEVLTPEQVAALLQVSPRTVEEWRRTRSGPPWRRMGRHVGYLRREVLAWFEDLDSDD